jgi:hypothetical protein
MLAASKLRNPKRIRPMRADRRRPVQLQRLALLSADLRKVANGYGSGRPYEPHLFTWVQGEEYGLRQRTHFLNAGPIEPYP